MPTTVTPNPDSLDATIDIPIDGELAAAATVGNSDTSLLNLGYFNLKRLQHCAGRIRARCDGSFGIPDEKTIRVYPILGFVVIDTAVRFRNVLVNTDINETNLEGGGNYANNTFYYVYVYVSGGVSAFQISTTAPDAYRIFKSGGTTHKYLFSFWTNGLGRVNRFYFENGTYTSYSERAISTTNPTVATSVSLVGFLPPHAKRAIIRSTLDNSAGAGASIYVGPTPTDVAGGAGRRIFVGPTSLNSECYELPLDESQSLDHIVSANTTFHALTFVGWKE